MENEEKIYSLVLNAVLGGLLAASGMIKIPAFIPGAEFQLSAPLAVVLVACFGFKRYFIVGLIASVLNFLLGTHTIINIIVSLVFRIVAGGMIEISKVNWISLSISGPVGTLVARIVLACILHVSIWPLIMGAMPGMIFTAVGTNTLYPMVYKIIKTTVFKRYLKTKETITEMGKAYDIIQCKNAR